MRISLIISACFAVGVTWGAAGLAPGVLLRPEAGTWSIYVLMVLVGLGVGGSGRSLSVVRKVRSKILLVPLAVVVGTFLGAMLAAWVLPSLKVRDSLAVGAGFGYYSLSSIIIKGTFHNETLAAVTLVANLLREMSTILLAPLLVAYLGKLAPIGTGGATTMDTTLPIITRWSGAEYGMIAAFSGLVLSMAVPVLVPLIMAAS
jgi:uncharacterized membrane protein YbjE (DUF340 family)